MRGHRAVAMIATVALVLAAWVTVSATDAEMYFSADRNGEQRVTEIREGSELWLVVYDPDEDIDCDVRDKIWTDIKVVDAKTGAYIVWDSVPHGGEPSSDPPHRGHFPGNDAGSLAYDYLEETGAKTGLFASKRPFQFGSRVSFSSNPRLHAHITGPYGGSPGAAVVPTDFQWGGYLYSDLIPRDGFGDDRVWVSPFFAAAPPAFWYEFVDSTLPATHVPPGAAFLPGDIPAVAEFQTDYTLGRLENMDTIMGLYQDQNDDSDIAIALAKITDSRSSLSWSREVYRDGNESASITITDDDENLNCNAVEYVPVFVIVNPGAWNPVDNPPPETRTRSANNFCMLKRYGGVVDTNIPATVGPMAMDWFNIYDSGLGIFLPEVDLAADGSDQPNEIGSYYIQYPNANNIVVVPNVTTFDTASDSGVTRCMFYAQETGANTGVFEFHINSLRRDLGFRSFRVGDVLAAYYVDPNDQDDFSLGTASISDDLCTSTTTFTDADREPRSVLWLGRDAVYVEVVDRNANVDTCCPETVIVHICDPHEVDDSEWLILHETSSDSPVFFSEQGVELSTVWDALGVGLAGTHGGYQLQLDNWRLEGFNEDVIYARYNDVAYTAAATASVGDTVILPPDGEFPPTIQATRAEGDISFAVAEIGDTQVVTDGVASMIFLDREGNRVDRYLNSSGVFVEVEDPDQDEDPFRRERIDAYWDGLDGLYDSGQNTPFAPVNAAPDSYPSAPAPRTHPVNDLLGYDYMLDLEPLPTLAPDVPADTSHPKLYVFNPRSGRWAAFDLLETGVDTGIFRSTVCIDLVSQYEAVPTLDVLPGDTIIAFYQDPSNHSDNAWISIKVSCGGGSVPGTQSSVAFVDADGTPVDRIMDTDPVNVRVVDPSHGAATRLAEALEIDGERFDITVSPDGPAGTFFALGLPLDLVAGQTVTATYTDPTDPLDQSSGTVLVISSVFELTRFVVDPNPFQDEVRFGFEGTGVPATFSVSVYDLRRRLLWTEQAEYVMDLVWDGRNLDGEPVGKGAYVYVVTAADEERSYTEKDVLVRY
ncbi:MAG: hypothetical protein JSW65_03870 [Candidatus Bipolaricaulota bacterium]|nr:MAG: hypothetical protein JSW65_03870 [Candidatus Bipolaricaulota bacterium]